MTRKELTEEALSLPLEERALLADALLRSMNASDSEDVNRRWAEVARRRLDELRAGTVGAIPGDEVFDRIRSRFKT